VRVLIIPDKFKGTLSAQAAARAIARGWRRERPRDALDLLPMSDGGDGFGEVTAALLNCTARRVRTVDAAHRPCRTPWWWHGKDRTAIIESARIIGLATLPTGRFHPHELDTLGLGQVIRAAARSGANLCVVGIGGSATNDGGFGLARALGWEFLDASGHSIERWTGLDRLRRIQAPRGPRLFAQVLVAVDVQNPLLGPRGATRVYGPQKGLRPSDFASAERCLRRLAQVARAQFKRDFEREPGAGAAGGLGFGLLAFLGARLEPGFDLFARLASLPGRLRAADLVITGEGAIDASTFMGKGTGQIARQCRRLNTPCVGLAGSVGDASQAAQNFTQAHGLTEHVSIDNARTQPARYLERLAQQVASSCHGT
jgi:glycerate 2-kinase